MARQINFFDGASSGTVPTIGNLVTSSLVAYPDDATFEANEQGSPVEGNIYFNTTSKLPRYYNGISWINVADEESTQSLQNKTIDGTDATGNNTVSIDATDASYDNGTSGLTATDAQAAIDEVEGRVDTAETNITTNAGDIDDLETLSGSPGATDHGTFTGNTISDNNDTKGALQELETEVELKINSSEKGAANGVASLDGSGKVPESQLPSKLLEFQGNWDASTNTPTLANTDTGVQGNVYRCSVAGTVDFGAGNITFAVGDWCYNDGITWEKGDNVDQVTSVNSQIGDVILDPDDLDDTSTTNKFNQTHTGEVTGSGALTVASTSITNKTEVAPESGDFFLFSDTSDSGNLKKVDFDDLGAGGSGQGVKNYVLNTNAEKNIDDTSEFDQAEPTNSGVDISQETTSPLRGAGSFKLDYSSFSLSGDKAYFHLDGIDDADDGKRLEVSFEYSKGTAWNSYNFDVVLWNNTDSTTELLGDLIAPNSIGDVWTFKAKTAAIDATKTYYIGIRTKQNFASIRTIYVDNIIATPEVETKEVINYIKNPKAESGVNNWQVYDDGAVATPVDGLGGFPNVGFFTNQDTPASVLRGDRSFRMTTAASNRQGEGVSTDFTIDNADLGKKLYISFDYSIEDVADYQAGFYKVFVYDVDNASMSEVTNSDNGEIVGGDGNKKFLGVFYPASDSNNYRLIIHTTTTNTSTFGINFDNVKVAPDSFTPTAILTEWVSESGTGAWSNTTYDVWTRRVGDTKQVYFRAECTGVPASGNFLIDVGDTIDQSNKIFNNDRGVVGWASVFESGGNTYSASCRMQSSTQIRVVAEGDNSSGSVAEDIHTAVTPTAPFAFGIGDRVFGYYEVPISGWGAGNVISTTERLHRNVDVRGEGNGATVLTANTTNIDFTETSDFFGAWSGSVFTAYKAGRHKFKGFCTFSAAYSGLISGYINGTIDKLAGNGTGGTVCSFDVEVDLQPGDTFSLRSDTGATLSNSTTTHWISASMIQDLTSFGVYGEFDYRANLSAPYQATTSSRWYPLSGNDITLTPGTWVLLPSQLSVMSNGASCSYTRVMAGWFAANPVGESAGAPAELDTLSTISLLSNTSTLMEGTGTMQTLSAAYDQKAITTSAVIVQVFEETTVYLVPKLIINTNIANSRIEASPTAIRLR